MRGIFLLSVAIGVIISACAGCDKVREWLGAKKGGNLARESVAPGTPRYDKVALKRRFGEPQEATETLAWIKKENGLRYNNRWLYYYRKNKDSSKITTRILYFVDDEFQGSVIIDEDGRPERETIGLL